MNFYTFCRKLLSFIGLQNVYFVTSPLPPICIYRKCKGFAVKGLFLLLFFMGYFITPVLSQSDSSFYKIDSLPNFACLVDSLEAYYKLEAAHQIDQFTYIEKYKWLKFAPSFGWNITTSTPVIYWNSNELFNALNWKRKNKAQIISIIHKVNLAYQKASIQLRQKHDLFYIKQNLLKQKVHILRLEKAYIGLKEEQYEKHQLPPSQWITSQIAYENKILELINIQYDLVFLKANILELAFFGERLTLLDPKGDDSGN